MDNAFSIYKLFKRIIIICIGFAPMLEFPFMYGWIVGCENVLSMNTQIEVKYLITFQL